MFDRGIVTLHVRQCLFTHDKRTTMRYIGTQRLNHKKMYKKKKLYKILLSD